ncbi:hypothetical protein NliqN6_5898 [Naganishia liquefaciens]|uniref:Vacuolar import and degradation protein 21 n=1 Tax=Naganishia liquefaciens TaxID=104408 RepID=A0A8H3TZ14_9TREE|nr:hypothetical protein NliqN6_5898 [Naganishia liquefaciens]
MDPDVTPSELAQAVALLVREKSDARTEIQHARDGNLRALYRLIRSVVAGNGMLDVGAEPGEGENQEQDAEAWELFRNEARFQDGTLKIALPDFDAVSASERRQQEEDIVEQKMLVDESPGQIAFAVPTISAPQRQVYRLRFGESDNARPAPKWLNGRLNSAAYEPSVDPHIVPSAASGVTTELGFGSTVEGVGEGLIPLESPYAANLHPLPHVQHHSKHRHHRESGKRDRTRSDGQASTVDNPHFGNWSLGVPPSYVQPSQRRQKVEAFQAQVGNKDQTDAAASSTINPVMTNPTDASTSLSSLQSQDTMEGKTITNPIHSSTLAPATRDIHALRPPGKPSDLYELGVGFRINPVSRAMKKTNKCVTSRDWQTAYEEIKYLRAMERIEQLKTENAWSFRQMKRFKGPVMGKVHWDYVLDEMRWMATDFKEERRWKLAAAYEMALWCQDWHLASETERAQMSVGGRPWGGQSVKTKHLAPSSTDEDEQMKTTSTLDDREQVDEVVEEMEEREAEVAAVEKELGKESVVEGAFKKESLPTDSADGKDGDDDADGEEDDGEDAVGEEEVEEAFVEDAPDAMDVDPAEPTLPAGLKTDATDATLAGAESELPPDDDEARRAQFEARVPMLRKPILDVDRTSLGVDVAAVLQEATSLDDTIEVPSEVGLVDIFPDLAVFGPPAAPSEGKFEKRLDEAGSGSRMAHVSRLFDLRPVMLTALSPSRNRAPDGRWTDAVGPMYDVEEDLNDSSLDDPQISMDIFRAHKVKGHGTDGKILEPEPPKYPEQRLAALVWEDQDDEVLLRAAKDYDYNWRLVADVVNSARVYVSTEKRTPWDCFDRWAVKIGYPSKRLQALAAANAAATAAANAAATAAANAASQSTLPDGSANPAAGPSAALPAAGAVNPSISGLKAEDGQAEGPSSPGGSNKKDMAAKPAKTTKYEGSKKKVRATVLRDSIRRIQKRREANKAKQNVGRAVVIVHESHLPYLEKRGVLSPQELGEMAYQQMIQRAEQARQLQQQQARLRQLSAQAQQGGPAPAGAATSVPGPNGQMIPGQTQPIRPGPPPSTPGAAQQLAFSQAQQQLMAQALQQQQQLQQNPGGMPRPPMNQNLTALQNAHRAGLAQANMRLQLPQNPAAAAAVAASMAQRASQSPASNPAQVQALPNMVRPPGIQNSPRPINPGIPRPGSANSNPTQANARPNANAALSSSVGQHLMNLMREAGISSMNQIPVPDHPNGGSWTPEQIKMYRMNQLQQWANPAMQTGNNGNNANNANNANHSNNGGAATPANNGVAGATNTTGAS